MKNLFLSVCVILLTIGINAQEKRKEVSVNFSSLNEFGLSYKSGTAKSLWRYHLLNINAGTYESENSGSINKNTTYGLGATIGKEFRNSITDNLEFRYGADVGLGFKYSNNISESENITNFKTQTTSYVPSFNGVIGLNYIFAKNLALGVELLPGISYTTETSKSTSNAIESEEKDASFNFNLSNNSARISLAYRF